MNIVRAKRTLILLLPAAALSGCVWQSTYDELQSQYNALQGQYSQLQGQYSQMQAQNGRLTSTIGYVVNDDLAFKSGSWELSDAGEQTMARVAQQLAPYQTRRILINGYTDNQPVGAALRQQGVDSNATLSEKRAEAVAAFLAQHGVRQDMMTTKGWGEQQPVASNNTPAGRAQNRRVEISFADQGAAGSTASAP